MWVCSVLLSILWATSAVAVCTKTVTVATGNTCDGLAISEGVSSYQINFLNNNACSSLQLGQVLCVKDTTYNCQPVYTVQSGDYCYGISDTHGISFERFIANNPQLDPTSCPIYPGMTVCVSPTDPTTTPDPSTPPPGTCTRSVTVASGNTCDALAISQGVSSYQINFLNNNGCNSLQVGQVLCLERDTYNCQPVYTVVSGDYCYGIADAHGISFAQLIADNPQLEASTCAIYPGLSLCVSPVTPGGPSVPPTTTTTTTSTTTATTPTSTTTSTPTGCTKYTTVKAGESCDLIAQRSQISIYNLQRINPTISCASLVQGDGICVDAHEVDCSMIYIVDGTEGGCISIAAAHDITFTELRALNPNINEQCTNIYPGAVLCVAPDLPQVPPVSGCTRRYTIVVGDTCPSVAAKNSLTSVQLQALNTDINCNALVPGETLCSYSPALNICPSLDKVATGDSCFDISQRAEMSLVEWMSINPSINCDALIPGNLVCSAQGSATLPTDPSGTNPIAVPLCGSYNRAQQCCTKFSVSADLFSDLCLRTNGCQDNCAGDSSVVMPTAAATPTTTLTITLIPTPTATPTCDSCTADQCCSIGNTCHRSSSWYCESANGCISNCDNAPPDLSFAPGQEVFNLGNYVFPPGDYSATDGNPCGVCNAQKAGVTSSSGNYCCTQSLQCLPVEYAACKAVYGCVYNCIENFYQDPEACGNSGECVVMTRTVKYPFSTQTPA